MTSLLASPPADGFDVLDVCHRHTVLALGKLSALVASLTRSGVDDDARALAREIVAHFSTTARHHHEDEERHVFPRLLADGNGATAETVRRLLQDHAWIEQDWREMQPHLHAVAGGQGWFDLDFLREAAEVFIALMHEHIALEESLIYPLSRAAMPSGERATMRREMEARRGLASERR